MMPDATKWSLFDLLKTLDAIHAGEFHDEFARAAQGLGLELPVVALPPDPRIEHGAGSAPDGEDEIDGEVPESEQDRVYQFLAAQTEPVSLAKIIAELGVKKWTVTNALYRLRRKGRVEHAGHDAWQIRSAG
jgi:hypothetical protein